MNKLSLCVMLFAPIIISPANSDEMNLATCLLGEYSDICNHELLTKEQAKKVEQAELQAKYKTNESSEEQLRNARLEEASRAAHARKAATTPIKYADYTINFGRDENGASVVMKGRGLGSDQTLDGRDKRLVTSDRNREREYDKAIRNVQGTSVQSARIRADLENEKISGMSSGYRERDRKREYDKALRNVRGTGAHSADIRAKLELAKQGVDVSNYQYMEIRPVPSPILTNPSPINTHPGNLIDPFSGTIMPRTGAGYTDPRNGTFYYDVGAGVVNTRTGEFTPTNK